MSKTNFLKREYRTEPSRQDLKCGIVDGTDGKPAYTTNDRTLKWNAIIHNPNGREFQFVPVDNNIIINQLNGHDKEKSCDGMLLVDGNEMIAFIELKDVRTGGFPKAIEQLESTIKYFLKSHNYSVFKRRRAYIANIAHPKFQYSMKDDMEHFRSSLKFTLFPESNIRIF